MLAKPLANQETPLASTAETFRAYRRRLVAKGRHQLVVDLPKETVAYLDDIKRRDGLRSRSQVLAQLIEEGRAAAQTMI